MVPHPPRPEKDPTVSPRRVRRLGPYERPGGRGSSRPIEWVAGIDRKEHAPDGEWVVRHVSGATDRVYRCPGCEQEIRPGVPHVVSWPNWPGGAEERRHWHTACWRNRINRGPLRRRY
ncbi:hypothetical protein TBS_23440 [Thermobispora bispora]